MLRSGPTKRWLLPAALAAAAAIAGGCRTEDASSKAPATRPAGPPIRMVVMDPMAEKLTRGCIPGYAQRKYDRLGKFLEKRLARPVLIAHTEDLATVLRLNPGKVHVLVGKRSIVECDVERCAITARPIAMLTDRDGRTHTTGAFVVRADDPADGIADLAGRKIVFGPAEDVERRAAALAALKAAGVPAPAKLATRPSCNAAALDVVEKTANAAVISSYQLPRLVGCGVVEKGALRVVGNTAPVPFVTLFATDALDAEQREALLDALLAMRQDRTLLKQMESSSGFVPIAAAR